MPRVIIVGGGISGLALAYRLRQAAPGVELLLLERLDRPGGTMWTERREGFQVEIGPNGFLDNKPSTVQLCRDIGLAGELLAASEASNRNRYLFLGNKLRRLPSSLFSFATSDLISWRGKLSILGERFRRARQDGADESIDAFVRRRAGTEAAEVLADALVTGIHAGDPTLLSVQAAFPRLAAMEREHGSVMAGMAQAAKQRRAEAAARGETYRRGSQMWSCRGGLRTLVEALRDRLGPVSQLGIPVRRIERAVGPQAWAVHGEGRDHWEADAVVLACPAHVQAGLLEPLDGELAREIAGIPYCGVVVVALGYREPDVPTGLDGFGFIAPQRQRRDLLGVQWCSSIFPGRAPVGCVLLRALCGGWNRADVVGWDETRLVTAVREELRLAMGVTASPIYAHIHRWEKAIPQYHLGHLERISRIEKGRTRHPGLFLTGNAYQGVALNDCTEQAERLAAQVASFLNSELRSPRSDLQ